MRNVRCLWLGHKLKVLKDDKTIWCDVCKKKMIVVKKGYGRDGIDIINKVEPPLYRFIDYILFIVGTFSLLWWWILSK